VVIPKNEYNRPRSDHDLMIIEFGIIVLAGKIFAGVAGVVTTVLLPPLVKYSYDKSVKRRLALERANALGRGRILVIDNIDTDHARVLEPHIQAVAIQNADRQLDLETYGTEEFRGGCIDPLIIPKAEQLRLKLQNPPATLDINRPDDTYRFGGTSYRVRHRFRWARYLADIAAGRYPLVSRTHAHDLVIRKYMREHLEQEIKDLRKCDYRYIIDEAVEEYYILPKSELQLKRVYNSYPIWKRRQECAAEDGARITWKPLFPFSEAFGLRKKVVMRAEGS
jgi:hypothetical protein